MKLLTTQFLLNMPLPLKRDLSSHGSASDLFLIVLTGSCADLAVLQSSCTLSQAHMPSIQTSAGGLCIVKVLSGPDMCHASPSGHQDPERNEEFQGHGIITARSGPAMQRSVAVNARMLPYHLSRKILKHADSQLHRSSAALRHTNKAIAASWLFEGSRANSA